MTFTELTKKEFKEYLDGHELKSFLQTPEMASLKVKNGWQEYYVGVKEDEKVLCATMMCSKNTRFGKYFNAPRGYLIDFKNKTLLKFFTQEIKKFVKSKGGYVLNIEPKVLYKERDIDGNVVENGFDNTEVYNNLIELGYCHGGFYEHLDLSKQVRWAFVLELDGKSKEEIFNGFKPNTRNIIRKNQKYNVKVRELEYGELSSFTELVESSGSRKNFHSRTTEYYENMYNLFHENGEVKFLVSELDMNEYVSILRDEKDELETKVAKLMDAKASEGKRKELLSQIDTLEKRLQEAEQLRKKHGDNPLMAGAMFMLYGDEIVYLFSGTESDFMALKSQYLLQWEIIQYGIDNGYKIHNFYGINGNFKEDDDRFGLYTFKKSFNGKVVEYLGDFDLIINKPKYYLKKIISKIK
ncbi:MAG: aminoacyltransferase [Firmicutes bacterium]|nr:aminoacyltransferase [Bacillota bacterium]